MGGIMREWLRIVIIVCLALFIMNIAINNSKKDYRSRQNRARDLPIELISFDRCMSTEAVLAEIDKLGFQSLTARELSVALSYPFRDVFVITFSSDSASNRAIICLRKKRRNNLILSSFTHSFHPVDWGSNWDNSCQFVVIRK
jgi:hypothetical protein